MADKKCPQRTKKLWNIGLDDSMVNVPNTCQQRYETRIGLFA